VDHGKTGETPQRLNPELLVSKLEHDIQLGTVLISFAVFGFVVSLGEEENSLQIDIVSQEIVDSCPVSTVVGPASMKIRVYKNGWEREIF
jgi:hypothetical protein